MARFVYRGKKTHQISFPLGGIGTGCIGLAGNGRLIDWEIFGKPNKGSLNGFTHFAIKAEREGEVLDARVLQGDLPPPFMGDFAEIRSGCAGFGFGPRREHMAGAPHFEKVDFTGEFPVAKLKFRGTNFPGRVRMTAFNPFIPLNEDDSGIPAAFFEFEIKNPTQFDLEYSLCCALGNPLPSANIHRFRRGQGFRAMTLSSDAFQGDELEAGDLSVATDAKDVSYQQYWFRGAWFDNLEVYWRDWARPGRLTNREYNIKDTGDGNTAMLAAHLKIASGEAKKLRFVISWSFPNFRKYWDGDQEAHEEKACKCGVPSRWVHYYATQWKSSLGSARYALKEWERLYGETRKFKKALFSSTLPKAALDAVSSNLSLIKSPTLLRVEDGTLYGWEGGCYNNGCCEGSCTHVWNYAQALPFLFPRLERSMREANYKHNQDRDGGMRFRIQLPLGIGHSDFRPCADGQFGDVLKTYRDWKISGNDEWLKKLWPKVKKSIEYAWSYKNPDQWDTDKTGVLWGRQHHTLDMELFGPNSWLTGFYLAALKAGAEMAEHLGEEETAREYGDLFLRGKKWTDEHLFNGEYYHQLVGLDDHAVAERFDAMNYWNEEHKELKYQYGEGSEIDQVLAQWHANLYGLGEIFDSQQLKKSLQSLYKNNFKTNIREHFNACRIYSLNGEKGLVICDWPEGTRRPMTPLPYSGETMNGFEWAAAILMIQSGMVKEGSRCVKAIRARYDGERRNPWNEFECGSNYARSMASYALLNTFSGFQFDMTKKRMAFAPIFRKKKTFRCLWSLGEAWGEFLQKRECAELVIQAGCLSLKRIGLSFAPTSATVDGRPIPFRITEEDIVLEETIPLKEGSLLRFLG